MPPNLRFAVSAIVWGASSSRTSTATVSTAAPVAATASAESASRAFERPARTTLAPAAPSPLAISAPMPELAPVTTAILPVRSNIVDFPSLVMRSSLCRR